MATLQELEQAFVAADKAGNTEDAAAFAAEIERMRQAPTEQGAADPMAQAVNASQFGQMNAGPLGPAQTPADREAVGEAAKQVPLSLGSGLVEGLQRVVGGGKQLYGAVSDYFTRLDKADRGLKDKFTAQEMLRSAVSAAEAEQAGRIPEARSFAAGATQLGTLAVAPEAATPRATTVIGALAKNFFSGAAGGALTFEPDEDLQAEGIQGSKAGDALGGGLLSAGIGLLPSLPPAIKNVVGRGLARMSNEGRTAARVARMQSALPNTDVSLAQRTGVPELIYLEHRAYDLDQVNFFAKQTDDFIADTADALKQPLKPGQELASDAAIMKKVLDDDIKAFRRHASNVYEYGVSKAAATAAPDTTIPIDNFRNQIRSVLDDAKSYARVRETPPIKKEYVDHLESLLQPDKKSMTVKELSLTLKELTALQSSDDKIAKALGTRLRNQGLEADLDKLQTTPTTDKAIDMLLQTRAEYRRISQAADAMSDAAVYKLLDGASEPGEMIQRFSSYSPTKQASIRDFMSKNSPDLLRSLKQGVIDDAVAKSGVIREAADSQKSLDELQKTLFDGDVMRTSGLWNAKELQRIDGIADGLRVIKNARPNLGTSGTPVAPEDVAINLISRSGPFMARFITRALTSARASQFFTDPNIYTLMTRMNRSTTGTATNLAARAGLMSYLQENYPGEEQPK